MKKQYDSLLIIYVQSFKLRCIIYTVHVPFQPITSGPRFLPIASFPIPFPGGGY